MPSEIDLNKNNSSEAVFRMVVRAYQERVIRFISLFVENKMDCEEIASDVFFSLWGLSDKITDIKDLNNYLFITARNKALNHLRKESIVHVDLSKVDSFYFRNSFSDPEGIFIDKETALELDKAISELPEKTKMAFHLVRDEKMKYKEAADILGVSVRTLEKQIASAISKLKSKLL